MQTLLLGADHGGFFLKEALKKWLTEEKHIKTEDFGAFTLDPDDNYPDFAYLVAKKINRLGETGKISETGEFSETGGIDETGQAKSDVETQTKSETRTENPSALGILICRMGGGMAIAANRFPKARAVVCRDEEEAQKARTDNNANILVLEGDRVSLSQAQKIVAAFLTTPFAGGRHARRVEMLSKSLFEQALTQQSEPATLVP